MPDSSTTPSPPSTTDDHTHSRRQSGHINDLNKDIEHKKQAVLLKPNDPYLLGPLGEAYYNRFKQQQAPSDLDHAIEYITLTLSFAPEGHPGIYRLLTTLSVYHHQRFHLLDETKDLDQEIAYRNRAIMLDPDGSPFVLTGLSRAYQARFERLGNLGDLDESIHHGIRAASLMADDNPGLLGQLDNLGAAHRKRFERLVEPSELDKGIEYLTRAASLTPKSHHEFPGRLNELASCFNLRYIRLGDPNDLSKSIEYSMHALSLAPPTNPSLQAKVLANLSILQLLRFQLTKDIKDLEKGIEYNACAFSLVIGDHPNELHRLQLLGDLYYARFEILRDPDDLDLAIEAITHAVSLLTDKNEYFGDQLHRLGEFIHARWHTRHNPEDLDEDIGYKARAVALTPELNSHYSRRIESLGRSYLCKSLSKYPCDHQQMLRLALDCFKKASLSTSSPPMANFTSACIWARTALKVSLTESLEAYQVAIDFIPNVIWLGSTVAQRYHDIKNLSNLAGEAASIAIKARNYKLALEWLEQGRSIIMNQNMMLQHSLDNLHSTEPMLAENLQKVTAELKIVALRDQAHYDILDTVSLGSPEAMADRHRELAKEHTQLLSRVRQLPGFESFLKPKQAPELFSAARTGPVVIVNVYTPYDPLDPGLPEYSCHALILQPGMSEIAHLPLPKFNSRASVNICSYFNASILRGSPIERGVRRIKESGSDFAGTLAALWNDVVKPVIDFLGYEPSSSPEELPHITWCATGILSSLPLHAAGIYGASSVCVSDYAISSYIPSLTALLSSSTILKATSILAVGQEQTPGSHSSLPGAAQELYYLQTHTSDVISYTRLTNENATIEAVLDGMERHDCVHLACHAHQNVDDPTKSGFFLHDGTLNLTSIMRRSFKNKGLAFLSACQTAMGDAKLPNETVHLASSLLTAGYPSVIATIWSVWDKDAPFVADQVYGQLLKDGEMDCRNSAKALHYAVLALRKEIGNDKFERWVPFIHIGM